MHHSLTKVWGVGVGVWVPFQRPDVSQICLKLVKIELAEHVVHWTVKKGEVMPTPMGRTEGHMKVQLHRSICARPKLDLDTLSQNI